MTTPPSSQAAMQASDGTPTPSDRDSVGQGAGARADQGRAPASLNTLDGIVSEAFAYINAAHKLLSCVPVARDPSGHGALALREAAKKCGLRDDITLDQWAEFITDTYDDMLRLHREKCDALDKLDAIRSYKSQEHQSIGSRWQHLKTGHIVTIVGTCRLEATNEPAFLYNHDGVIWARSMDQFLDGRFDRAALPRKDKP